MDSNAASDGYRNPERWKQMEVLLEAIEGLDPSEVPVNLKQVCVDDLLLAEQVLDFWQRARLADDLLEAPILEGLHLLFDEESQLSAELANLPDCRVLEKLGEGGMGRVYLVEQNAPARRLVALKILSAACSPERLKRFQLELGALARMNHENVARLYQFGFTPDRHIPYYLMEYFPGQPITEFANQQHMGLDQRLHLMLEVFKGVEHAHQKGLIHRDIKPNNILVALSEGKIQVKLIDFGIAKALSVEAVSPEGVTEAGYVLGTPSYMSPEQWDPGAELIDTRSDIYSLGAVLYELVSGQQFIDSQALKGLSLSAKIAYIREHQPQKLSRIPQAGLPRDLDWVFDKATRFEKTERYPSISHFSADIRAILSHRPVLARPTYSTWYTLRKYLRRHRKSVWSGLCLTAFLFVLVGSAFQNHMKNQIAEKRTNDAFVVLGRALSAPNSRMQGPQVTLGEAFRELSETLPRDLDPIVRAKVLTTMAETLSSIEENELAYCCAADAAALLRSTPADPHDIAVNRMVLARLHQLAGRFDLAVPYYTAALDTGALDHKEEIQAKSGLAEVFRLSGLPELAIPIYEALPEVSVSGLNQIARWRGLADCYARVGAIAEASAVYSWALNVSRHETGETSADTLQVRIMYAHFLRQQGKLPGAPALLGLVFKQAKHRFGLHHRLSLEAWLAMTTAERAESCNTLPQEGADQILEIAEQLDAPPMSWRVSLAAASVLRHQGRLEEAERALARLFDKQWERVAWDDEDLLRTASNLADLYMINGSPELTRYLLSDLLSARRRKELPIYDADFIAHVTLAEACLALDRKKDAAMALSPLRPERAPDQWEWNTTQGFKLYVKSLNQRATETVKDRPR